LLSYAAAAAAAAAEQVATDYSNSTDSPRARHAPSTDWSVIRYSLGVGVARKYSHVIHGSLSSRESAPQTPSFGAKTNACRY